MNLGVVIGYGISETKEMAQNWRGADMFCVILCDCDCDCCDILILILIFFLFKFSGTICFHDTISKEDRLPVATHSLYQVK